MIFMTSIGSVSPGNPETPKPAKIPPDIPTALDEVKKKLNGRRVSKNPPKDRASPLVAKTLTPRVYDKWLTARSYARTFKQGARIHYNTEFSDLANVQNLRQNLPHTTNPLQKRIDATAILCKDLASEWGLRGKVMIGLGIVNLEGSYPYAQQAKIAESVKHFFAFLNDREEKKTELSRILDLQRKIQTSLKRRIIYSANGVTYASQALSDFNNHIPVTITSMSKAHGVEITLYKDKNNPSRSWLVYTNRGATTLKDRETMRMYEIKGEVDKELFQKLALDSSQCKTCDRITWIEQEMFKQLKAEHVGNIPRSKQKVGNCSWANPKGGFYAELILFFKKIL